MTIDSHEYHYVVVNGTVIVAIQNLIVGCNNVVECSYDSDYADNYTLTNFTFLKFKQHMESFLIEVGSVVVP